MRLQREITQEIMANLLNMTQATYSRKERGLTDMTLEEWDKIAKVFDVDKDEIFEDTFKKGIQSANFKKQYLVIPNTLLEQIDFLRKENLDLKEKLKKYENQ